MSDQLPRPYNVGDAFHDWFVGGGWRREMSCFAADGMGIVAMATKGCAGYVEFDFPRIWEAMKAAPKMPKMVWMYHSHPPGCSSMSPMDENAVKGWATALGMPIQMIIVTDDTPLRYLCLKGNVVLEQGASCGLDSERFLMAAMYGMSVSAHNCSASELDDIVVGLNQTIPTQTWDFDYRNSLAVDSYVL